MAAEKVIKVRYLNDAGIELLRQGHMKNTKEFLYVTVKNRKLYILFGASAGESFGPSSFHLS